MKCKICGVDIRPDCMLMNRVCVFCFYKIKSWDSNGRLVKKQNAIIKNCSGGKQSARRKVGENRLPIRKIISSSKENA